MADKNIGSLPNAAEMSDDALLVIEQQGAAHNLRGAQLKKYAYVGVSAYVEDAKTASETAMQAVEEVREIAASVESAGEEAARAEAAADDAAAERAAAEAAKAAAEQARNEAQAIAGGDFLPLAGGTMTGPLLLAGEPTAELQAAHKGYVDKKYNELFQSVSDGKETVASAVTDMGVDTAEDATFATMAENIRKIDTSVTPEITVDDNGLITARAGKKSATKQLPTNEGKKITPSAVEQLAIPAGTFATGDIVVEAVSGGGSANPPTSWTDRMVSGTVSSDGKTLSFNWPADIDPDDVLHIVLGSSTTSGTRVFVSNIGDPLPGLIRVCNAGITSEDLVMGFSYFSSGTTMAYDGKATINNTGVLGNSTPTMKVSFDGNVLSLKILAGFTKWGNDSNVLPLTFSGGMVMFIYYFTRS